MKHSAILMLIAGALQATPAAAQLCVGKAYDQPLAGALDVVMRYADVPSSQFPGIWQEGLIDGSFYQIFSNRIAVLRADQLSQDWSITVDCQQRPCVTTLTGNPPEAAKATSTRLAQCLEPPPVKVAAAPAKPNPEKTKSKEPEKAKPKDPVTPEVKKPAAPKPEPAATPPAPAQVVAPAGKAKVGTGSNGTADVAGGTAAPSTKGSPSNDGFGQNAGVNPGANPAVNSAPATEVVCMPVPEPNIALRPLACGLSLVPPGTPEMKLQRLLVLAGADPGPVDGAIGSKTKDAMLVVLGFAGRNMDLQQSIAAVDAYLCRQGQPLP